MRWMKKRLMKRPLTALRVTQLEDRVVPATFTVTNLLNSGAGSLRQAVINANSNPGTDTIVFNVNGAITLSTELTISDSVIIEGNNASLTKISGGLSTRLFNITSGSASTVTLSKMTLTNGSATLGGAIHNNAQLTLVEMAIYNNFASDDGGAIYCLANSTLTVSRTEITGNSATDAGGGIFTTGTVTVNIRNSTIGQNTAGGTGGAFSGFAWNNSCSFLLENSTVYQNTANGGGGGLRVQAGFAPLNIKSSVVSNNSGPAGSPDIAAGTVNVSNSLVGNLSGFTLGTNSANLAPGTNPQLGPLAPNESNGVYSFMPALTSPLRDSGSNGSFYAFDARGSGFPRMMNGVADIGAVEVFDLVVRNTNNTGKDSLRQQILDANGRVGANTINFDSTLFSTAKTITVTSEIPISDDLIINAPSNQLLTINGGGSNRILSLGSSGFSTITLRNLTLTNGSANDDGGAIRIGSALMLNFEQVTIQNSQAAFGGAISNGGNNSSTIILKSSTIHNNKAKFDGGGIWSSGFVDIQSSTISSNTASNGEGGGIYTGAFVLSASSMFGNSASSRGGAIATYSDPLDLRYDIFDSTIAQNTAGSGGAVSLGTSTGGKFNNELLIRNSTIRENSAAGGGAITTILGNVGTSIKIFSSVVSGNTANIGPNISTNFPIEMNFSALGTTSGINPTLLTGAHNLPFGIDLKLGNLGFHGGDTKNYRPDLDSPLLGQGAAISGLTPLDQRGFVRNNNGVDIGSVELTTAKIVSIVRASPNPTSASAVSWTVTTSAPLDSFPTIGNTSFSGSGKSGALIINVTGSGTTWTVSALTGAEGLLTLNVVNDAGYTHAITNLPFASESYTVNKVPLSAALTASKAMLTDANVGTGTFTLTAAYSEPMDTASTPTFSFPTPGENPGSSLVFQSGAWTDNKTYVGTYNVADLGLSMANIDVQVSGGSDEGGIPAGTFSKTNLFSIDTQNPVILGITRNDPLNNKLANVNWTVTFSEPVTGVAAGNFALFNGGLTGSPAITSVNGSGTTWTVAASTGDSGSGTLGLTALSAGTVADANGNPLAALPVTGGAYAIDFISPAASKLTLNTLIISDANVGPDGFTATLKYNELMNTAVNPVVSFPVEFPSSLTFSGGSWLDAQTYQARFNVADLGIEQNDIDIRFSGGEDLAGNIQVTLDAVDLFDIDTQNPIISTITSSTPDGTYSTGEMIDITLNFSEAVELTGTLNVTLDTGAVVAISGPQSGTSLSGIYVVASGDNSPDLNVITIALTGGSTLRDEATNNSVLTLPGNNLANNSSIVISTTSSPIVTNIIVNNDLPQRSLLTTIQVNFQNPVDAAAFTGPGAITLTRTGSLNPGTVVQTGTTGANGRILVSPAAGLASSLVLTFDNANGAPATAGVEAGSLTDGYWQLAIPAANYLSPLNSANLRRVFGDSDGNGTIDATDFAEFGATFGTSGVGLAFDFDGNGTIDSTDFAAFGSRFGISV